MCLWIMKINIFRGELTYISAKTEALCRIPSYLTENPMFGARFAAQLASTSAEYPSTVHRTFSMDPPPFHYDEDQPSVPTLENSTIGNYMMTSLDGSPPNSQHDSYDYDSIDHLPRSVTAVRERPGSTANVVQSFGNPAYSDPSFTGQPSGSQEEVPEQPKHVTYSNSEAQLQYRIITSTR